MHQEISATLHNLAKAVSPDPLFSEGLASETSTQLLLEHTYIHCIYVMSLDICEIYVYLMYISTRPRAGRNFLGVC